jgi:broad specificity phosphatase PhoE
LNNEYPIEYLKMPPTFIFVRHGEAKHNVSFHQKGESAFSDEENRDAPLTEKGIEQARESGKRLSSYHIIDIWSSPLTRCMQTAEEIFEECDAGELYLHDNLLECLGGGHICNTRKSKRTIQKERPIWHTRFLPDFPPDYVDRETFDTLNKRMLMMMLFLNHLYKDQPSQGHILVVSHRDAIFALTKKDLTNAEFAIMTMDEILKAYE